MSRTRDPFDRLVLDAAGALRDAAWMATTRPPRPTRRRDLPALVSGILALGWVSACVPAPDGAVPGLADARATWAEEGSGDYTVTLESTCGERALIGRFSVTVAGGAVIGITGLDEPGRRNAEIPSLPEQVPSISGLLERMAVLEPEQVPEASFDDVTGMPTRVAIDPLPNGVDDEECYGLSSYVPAGSSGT